MRSLRRDPLYAAALVGTLALTLGASTAAFSIVNGVMLRPLAFREAQRLVSIRGVEPTIARRYATLPANARHLEEWRSPATSLAALAALDWRTTSVNRAGRPAQVPIVPASGTALDAPHMAICLG